MKLIAINATQKQYLASLSVSFIIQPLYVRVVSAKLNRTFYFNNFFDAILDSYGLYVGPCVWGYVTKTRITNVGMHFILRDVPIIIFTPSYISTNQSDHI